MRPPALTGLGLSVAGLLLWAVSLPELAYALSGAGIGLLMSPTNTDALGRVEPHERSQASGLIQTVRQLGATLGLAVIGAVVLDLEHSGGAQGAGPRHTVWAIVVAFLCAVTALTASLVAGWFMLPRGVGSASASTQAASAGLQARHS